jgi:hypothetical protein
MSTINRPATRTVAALLTAIALGAIMATTVPAATGPEGQSLNVSPSTVAPGGSVTVTGDALTCNDVTLLSAALRSTHEFAGVPAVAATPTGGGHFRANVTIPANRAPGNYSIGARACGGNLGVTVTLHVTNSATVPSTGAAVGAPQLLLAALLVIVGTTVLSVSLAGRRAALGRER